MFGFGGPRRPEVVAFDAIGTLFPVEPLRELIMPLGLPGRALETVIATAYRNSMTVASIGEFRPFLACLGSALDEVLDAHGLRVSGRARSAVLGGMKLLSARPDAGTAFRALKAAGIGVAVLTNGAAKATDSLLDRNGLGSLVDLVVSSEEVKLAKPRPEPYGRAAKLAGVKRRRLALVSVHAWDIKGADSAGLVTGYVTAERPFDPLLGRPDVQGPTLLAVAQALAAL